MTSARPHPQPNFFCRFMTHGLRSDLSEPRVYLCLMYAPCSHIFVASHVIAHEDSRRPLELRQGLSALSALAGETDND